MHNHLGKMLDELSKTVPPSNPLIPMARLKDLNIEIHLSVLRDGENWEIPRSRRFFEPLPLSYLSGFNSTQANTLKPTDYNEFNAHGLRGGTNSIGYDALRDDHKDVLARLYDGRQTESHADDSWLGFLTEGPLPIFLEREGDFRATVHSQGRRYPHAVVGMHHVHRGEENHLARCEVEVALTQLQEIWLGPQYRQFGVAPVLVISYFRAGRGRIIQADYQEGKKVVLHCSPIIDLEEDSAHADIFVQYETGLPLFPAGRYDDIELCRILAGRGG